MARMLQQLFAYRVLGEESVGVAEKCKYIGICYNFRYD